MPQLDIIITNKVSNSNQRIQTTTQQTTGGNTATSATRDSAVKTTATSIYVHQLINTATSTGKNMFNFFKSQYANMTGDYIGQRKIDNVFNVVGGVTRIGSSLATGAMAGGVAGFLVAAAIETVNIGVNQFQADYQYNMKMSRAHVTANYNSNRIGSILVNGNRS